MSPTEYKADHKHTIDTLCIYFKFYCFFQTLPPNDSVLG